MQRSPLELGQTGAAAGDDGPTLFTPDTLLPSQHGGSAAADTPSRRLVAAVLERALLDAVGPSGRQADRDDALAWFRSGDEAPFSFRWIAHQLGIEGDWLLARVEGRQSEVRRRDPDAPATSAARRAA